jgi:glucoamylase
MIKCRHCIFVFSFFLQFHFETALSTPTATKIDNHKRVSDWMSNQFVFALEKRIIANINGFKQILTGSSMDADHWGLPGAVIAAPSVEHDPTRINPSTGALGEWQDYRGVWKRDAALTMRIIFRLMYHGPWKNWDSNKKIRLINNYATFSEFEQGTHRNRQPIDWGGAGDSSLLSTPLQEPSFDLAKAKVNPFAQSNIREWGEPQDDGPPLQSLALLDALIVLNDIHNSDKAVSIQDSVDTIYRVLRRNIRFIMETAPNTLKGQRTYYERWEETKAKSHFAVLLEQRYSLLKAKYLLLKNNSEEKINSFIGKSVEEIDKLVYEIEQYIGDYHLSLEKGHVIAHYEIDRNQGLVRNKESNLDVQVLMASLETNKFGDSEVNHFLSPNNPWMRATFFKLDQAFRNKYQINKLSYDPVTGELLRGSVWGRYPEDHQHFEGDPWFITTFTKVQYLLWDAIKAVKEGVIYVTPLDANYFLSISELKAQEIDFADKKSIVIKSSDPRFKTIVTGMVTNAKETFFRLMVHAGVEGELSEVFDQNSGFQRGIKNLTWSWVELLKTVRMFRRASNEDILNSILKITIPKEACDLALEGKLRGENNEDLPFSL